MLEYVRAAHCVGGLVRGNSQPGDVIAFIANVDAIVYSALITGIMKAGLVPFPISPQNSPMALLHLIRKMSACRVLMTQTTLRGVVDGLKAEIQMIDPTYVLSIKEVPSLQQGTELPHNGVLRPSPAAFVRAHHNHGICTYCDRTWGRASPENVLEAAQIIKPTLMLSVPSFIHTWAQSDKAVVFLRTLRCLQYGGGPLTPQIAESLIPHGVHIVTRYGGTEFGVVSELSLDTDETWQYFKFKDQISVRLMPQGDGTYEAQFLTSETHHVAVENLTDVAGYATSDLFKPHPTIPNLWKIVGQMDNVLIHSSGEKTIPGPLEGIISASPMLSGSIMFGRQRDQPGILLEPLPGYQIDVSSDAEVSKFRNLIWPIIEEANKIAPAFSRIFKEMILVVNPTKPLPRVGKGTVAREAAMALYDSEINKLSETVESNTSGNSVEPPKSWKAVDLQPWLVDQISDILSTKVLAATTDLFEHGFNSLSATIVHLHPLGALRKSGYSSTSTLITQNIVYSHPTIAQLTEAISNIVINPNESKNPVKTPEETMEEMIAKYPKGLDAPLPIPGVVGTKQYILLTGSTGNLGAQILESLLRNKSVARVYTLNRPSSQTSMLNRHCARFQDKALDIDVLSSPKLVFLTGETSHDDLGLALRQHLTMVIHNAWRLDFNLSLASFEPHVKGSRVLIDLARSSQHSSSIRFLFMLSISSTQSWNAQAQGPYPEHVVMDAKYAVGGGYGESRYVTEWILAKSGLQATSLRIGQITGASAPNGAWATTDWVPITLKSSLSLGILPDAFGVVSWISMDAVCDALLDIGFSEEPAPIAVNIVHPRPISWTSVMQHLRVALLEVRRLPADAL
ncbi:hypothetical protein BDP27DRAFT_1434674 [Rhodocollybia butyracea]|uniref:Thioester reductase (TE) domain-containing protein n=1 Tax=Rhodocollybia butyracea TaxID=206335 RepID=A0A9P5P8D9_9AGAR|nr:hypothetical protein BDP27DRAFT_1434674 [Rhodocollybia butyracea]